MKFIYVILALFALVIARWLRPRRSNIGLVPGPPSPSFLFGNLIQLLLSDRYGKHEFQWQKRYGAVYRVKGCFLEDRLMVSDPVAFKHIINSMNTFELSYQIQSIINIVVGNKSVFYVKGDDHHRIRGIMNAAFTPAIIRELPPLFDNIAHKLAEHWETMVVESEAPDGALDVYPTLHNATLDGVGVGALGYEFGAMDEKESELAKSHHDIVALSAVRSKIDMLFEALVPLLPRWALEMMLALPTESSKALRHNREVNTRVSAQLVEAQQEDIASGIESRKDLLHVMVRDNASVTKAQKMSTEEIQMQIPSIMFAGQETTGNTLSMALFELAKDTKLQDAVRAEILETYERNNGTLEYSEIESLKLFNAFLKEVLRLYPDVPMSNRVAVHDTVLPLSTPIVNTKGETMTELLIPKGQFISLAIASYNRLESVWGLDAEMFRPSRWLEGDPIKTTSFGPYAGLGTFLGGPRVCIGWKFAITEMQCILPVLIKKFKVKMPPNIEIHPRVAIALVPKTTEGKSSLPLVVDFVDA